GVPARYWKQLRCYEMSHSDLNAKPATLRKWREAAPEGASFIARIDPKLEEAASTLGASRAWVFMTVTLPLILPGILAGSILAFAKAMGEFGATITFVSNIPGQTQTLPSAIYAFLQVPGGEASALRLVIIAVIIAMGALLLSEVVSKRIAARVSA
ncbi:ABC transporter permease subunit, partial [Marivivens sp.]|uniref:ABC transporter permease subunit n=1 Tax=Marivivens sp. TaxID=1978374 RepID=UPI0025BA7DC1